jgi:hypothetical protein
MKNGMNRVSRWSVASVIALSGMCGAFGSGTAMAQMASDDVAPSFDVKPSLQVSVEQHDFGTIDDTQPVKTQIAFVNKGSGALNIVEVHATCGCTVPQLSKKNYAPGESGVIEVSFNPHNKKGAQRQTVTITSNDPVNPRKDVAIMANVTPLVSIEPQVVQFGQVVKGKGAKQTVKVVATIPNFKLAEVTTTDGKILGASMGETKESVDQKGTNGATPTVTEVEMTLSPDAPVGMVQQNVTIRTSDPNRILNVTVVGEVLGDVNVQPPRLALGALTVNQTISQQMKLTHRSGAKFNIIKAEEVPGTGDKRLSVAVKPDGDKGDSWTLEITGTAPAAAGGIKGDIVVTTDIPGETEIRLPYFGFARAQDPNAQSGIEVNPTGGPAGPAAPAKPIVPIIKTAPASQPPK